jgi:membrane-bound PQQ-dependent dehydrogenase (glucose/quinate/shikimate family)
LNSISKPPRNWLSILTGAVVALAGLGLAAPGAMLVALGGSFYYLLAGLGLIGSGVLIVRGRPAGLLAYAGLILLTLLWSLWEAGLDGWALMPRLVFWIVSGAVIVLTASKLAKASGEGRRARLGLIAATGLALATFVLAWALHRQIETFAPVADGPATTASAGDWLHFGGSLSGTRYSGLDEITPANVGALEQAWVYRSGPKQPGGKREGGLQLTPLMVDGTVYGCTAFNSVFALDPVTGAQLWRHDPVLAENAGGHAVCRGISFFRAPAGTMDCPTRLLVARIDNQLEAIDARTGKACTGFGINGLASMMEGRGDFPIRWSHPTSPATIVNGTAVVGAYVVDNQSTNVPPGVIRGFDALTGKLLWAFDPARPDDTKPLPPGRNYTPSTPNSWTVFSGDEALGLVYVPMGNGSPDFFGGHRTPETERFTSAVVALDSRTGAVRWTFQAVHHDLWDYDLSAQPVLVNFPTGGTTTPALILPTKTGQLFVLDRRTGQPLTKVEERPVPRSETPGERASPTQPFSVGMPDMSGGLLTESHMWGLSPFDQLYCRIKFRQARYEGIYTPPRLGPSIRYPGELGGVDWGSVSVDERRGLLIVNSNHMANYNTLISRAEADKRGIRAKVDPKGKYAPGAAMEGTPYAVEWSPFMSGLEMPCQEPPFGYLTAIDLKTRKIVWNRTLGDARNSGPLSTPLGLPLPLGAPNIGGSLTTASGLIFIGATQDEMFRAIDTRTGKVLWQQKLPASGHAAPMSYRGRDGRQYVLIAAGGRSLRDKGGDHFIAYRLKR